MKVALIFVLFTGFAYGYSVPTRNLQDDFNDFLALLPVDKITNIAFEYLANDEEVQKAVEYLKSDEFQKVVVTIENLTEFKNLLGVLKKHGLDAISLLNKVLKYLELPLLHDTTEQKETRNGHGIKGLIDDVLAVLPLKELRELYEKKLKESKDFNAIVDYIHSAEFKQIIEKVRAAPGVKDSLQKLKKHGIDVHQLVNLVHKIFGHD